MAFRDLLEAGDVASLRRYWAEKAPNMPQPKNAGEAEIVMHRARTEAESVAFRHRAYSHAWLCERSLPSGLPDRLKPSAEKLYPVVKTGVMISVNFKSAWMRPAAGEVHGAMAAAVLEAEADGRLEDAAHVSARMRMAREKTLRALFGPCDRA
jgi:hypothetical protein